MLPSTVVSASGKYRVTIRSQDKPIPIGRLHRWIVSIEDRSTGKIIKPEALEIDGGMPAHGHGLPTAPKPASYREGLGTEIDGVRFNMAGLWQLTVRFQTTDYWDTATVKVAVGKRINVMSHASSSNWSAAEIAVLNTLRLSSGNQHREHQMSNDGLADKPAALTLGKQLFFDPGLSKNGVIACSTCHQPDLNFTDGLATATGLEQLTRNAPTLLGTGKQPWLYWDGRRDSLWSQALVPIEASGEMGSNRTRTVRYVLSEYREIYEQLFGAIPDLPADLPDDAGPLGTSTEKTAWSSLNQSTKNQINEIFVNTGKLIANWEATLNHQPTRFDLFIKLLSEGDTTAAEQVLNESERAGVKLFINNKAQCMNCHNSPEFTNFGFHNIGTGMDDKGTMDFGRMLGSQMALMNEFNCKSRYNGENPDCTELDFLNQDGHSHSTRGAFKVPTLRGLSKTAPYMHDGRFATLEEVMDYYIDPPAITGTMQHELPALDQLTEQDKQNLIAFLKTL